MKRGSAGVEHGVRAARGRSASTRSARLGGVHALGPEAVGLAQPLGRRRAPARARRRPSRPARTRPAAGRSPRTPPPRRRLPPPGPSSGQSLQHVLSRSQESCRTAAAIRAADRQAHVSASVRQPPRYPPADVAGIPAPAARSGRWHAARTQAPAPQPPSGATALGALARARPGTSCCCAALAGVALAILTTLAADPAPAQPHRPGPRRPRAHRLADRLGGPRDAARPAAPVQLERLLPAPAEPGLLRLAARATARSRCSAPGTVAALVRYNLLFLFAWSLCFVGAYLLARELGLGRHRRRRRRPRVRLRALPRSPRRATCT